jgi:hypothetical protein
VRLSTWSPLDITTARGKRIDFSKGDLVPSEVAYVAERRYASAKRPETGANYSIDSKGKNPPSRSREPQLDGCDRLTLPIRISTRVSAANRSILEGHDFTDMPITL